MTQAILNNRFAIGTLITIFLVRFLIGPWSYAAGCPGGLFAPLLLLGAASGAVFAEILNRVMPGANVSPEACAIVGMGALFTASVRAPLTGIVLTVEMTGRADLSLGLLAASLTAMLVTMLIQSEPIYESLKRRMFSQAAVSPRRVDAGVQRPAGT
jgi:CIC family chloride channel protein